MATTDVPNIQYGAVKPQATTNPLEAVFGTVAEGLQAYDQKVYNSRLDAQVDKEQGLNDAARQTFSADLTANSGLTGPALQSTQNTVGSLDKVQSAVGQGNLPPVAYTTQLQTQTSALLAKHPDAAYSIMEYMKSSGHDAAMFPALQAQQAQQKALQSGSDAALAYGVDFARKNGVDPNLPLSSQAQYGLDLSNQKAQQEQAAIRATAIRADQTLSADDKAKQLKINDNDNLQSVMSVMATRTNSITDSLRNLVSASGNNPDHDTIVETKLLPALDVAAGQAKVSAHNQLIQLNIGNAENFKTVDEYLDSQIGGIKAVYADKTGSLQKTLENLKTNYGIDTAKAAPLIFKYSQLVGNNGVAALLGPTSMVDPKLQASLAKEWSGVATSGTVDAQTHFNNIVSILNGNTQLKDYSQADAANYIGGIATGKNASEQAIITGKAVPKDGHVFLNSYSNLLNATHQLSPSASTASLTQASNLIATQNSRIALDNLTADPNTKEYATSAGMASHLTSIKLLQSWQQHAPEGVTKYQSIQYDPKSGTFAPVFDKAGFSQDPAFKTSDANLMAQRIARASQFTTNVQGQANTMNQVLDHATKTSKYDTDVPKGASPLDIRTAIATGRPLQGPGSGKSAADLWSTSEAAIENKLAAFPQIIQAQDAAFNADFQHNKSLSAQPAASPEVVNDTISKLDANAQKYTPKSMSPDQFQDLVRSVGYQESRLNPSATSPTGVKGTMQLTKGTAAMYGLDRDNPDQNIEGGVRYLSHLIDAHKGNVRDALMEYNGGSDPLYDRNVLRYSGQIKPIKIPTEKVADTR